MNCGRGGDDVQWQFKQVRQMKRQIKMRTVSLARRLEKSAIRLNNSNIFNQPRRGRIGHGDLLGSNARMKRMRGRKHAHTGRILEPSSSAVRMRPAKVRMIYARQLNMCLLLSSKRRVARDPLAFTNGSVILVIEFGRTRLHHRCAESRCCASSAMYQPRQRMLCISDADGQFEVSSRRWIKCSFPPR